MSPELDAISLTVGWLLGFLGTLLVQWVKRSQIKKDVRGGVHIELRETIPILVGTYFVLNEALGKIDRNVLDWVRSMSSESNTEHEESIKSSIENLLKLSNDQLAVTLQAAKIAELKGRAKFIKRFSLPFLEQNISSIQLLDSSFKSSVLNITRKVNWLNEEIDRINFFYEKTFDSGLTEENWQIIERNLTSGYQNVARLCRDTTELIVKLIKAR